MLYLCIVFEIKQQNKSNNSNNNKTKREMKVITSIQELDNAIQQLREEAINNGYDFFNFYIAGEETIRQAAAKYNLSCSHWKGLNGLFLQADNDVKGLSLSSGSALMEFVDVASIEVPTNSNYLIVDSIFKVVKYKDYLLRPFKNYSEKTYHFTFLQDPIKITIRTPKPNKVSVLTDKKADAWVNALLEDIKQSAIAAKAAEQRKREFMQKMSKLTNLPEETFAKSGRIDAGIVNIKWQFDEQGKAYTSVDWRLSTDEVLKKLSEKGLLENK